MWKCPECEREFAKRNQSHSCDSRSAVDHFLNKDPYLREAYEHLIGTLRTLGPLRVEAVKSAINFAAKFNFAAVRVAGDHLRVEFLLDHLIKSDRITKTERLSPTKIAYHVAVKSPSDVDRELIGWLKEAYTLRSR
ncbi:MAG: hypothetical protein DMF61_04935 [Blastocatellia bacterium AA13]|nr:MAG: hypothetical protein DMF61_04935 [Blastocatellia bacterium AA13]